MKLALIVVLAFCFAGILASTDICEEEGEEGKRCDSLTEYQEYIKCVQERKKRSVGCQSQNSCSDGSCEDDNCSSCDCDACSYNSCQNSCNSCCGSCCNTINSCSTNNCCHKTCHANCKSNSCRSSCKKTCHEIVKNGGSEQTKIQERWIETKGATNINNTLVNPAANHNITTIIHLNNMINNTNLINVPVVVNHTTINNISIEESGTREVIHGRPGQIIIKEKERGKDNCCVVIGPKQCVKQDKFPFIRCFHTRQRTCGYICTAPIVHYQQHEICDKTPVPVTEPTATEPPQQPPVPQCQQQIVYVPQPQPKCAYQQQWPYVSCNGAQSNQPCEGCYNHYINRQELTRCSSYCYDDGFGAGPYYRQGPLYRQGFAHVPSCYQTGTCNNGGFYNGYVPPNPYMAPTYPNGYGGGMDMNYGGFPFGNVGYPPDSYESQYPIIVDDANKTVTPIVGGQGNTNYPPNSDFLILNPIYGLGYAPYPYWGNFDSIPKDVNIEAKVEPTRSERYAEIKIRTEDEDKKEEEKEKELRSTTIASTTTT